MLHPHEIVRLKALRAKRAAIQASPEYAQQRAAARDRAAAIRDCVIG